MIDYLIHFVRIIDLVAKENAFEDCQVALKKAFEKDQLSLQDFLQVFYIHILMCL